MKMMLEVAMGIMEDDKVADMVLKIPDVTVAIGDTYGDDVRDNDVGAGQWALGLTRWCNWWLNI